MGRSIYAFCKCGYKTDCITEGGVMFPQLNKEDYKNEEEYFLAIRKKMTGKTLYYCKDCLSYSSQQKDTPYCEQCQSSNIEFNPKETPCPNCSKELRFQTFMSFD